MESCPVQALGQGRNDITACINEAQTIYLFHQSFGSFPQINPFPTAVLPPSLSSTKLLKTGYYLGEHASAD